ncbi:MAG: hypothetical protein VKO00_11485 [Cyanobacteriota bacterium]|nr:hypothetical protein [Cyanobacteriota bacterium]
MAQTEIYPNPLGRRIDRSRVMQYRTASPLPGSAAHPIRRSIAVVSPQTTPMIAPAAQLAVPMLAAFALGVVSPAEATTQTRCLYNGQPRLCSVREAHRSAVSAGNHVDIVWPDGERTSVRYLQANRSGDLSGMPVLINGTTRGQVQRVQALACGARGCQGVQITIRSSTGNVFSYTRFSATRP